MTVLKLKPLDTLFFGDGKPFRMGVDTVANGIFPPLPSTIFGAIRSGYIFQQENGLESFLKGDMETKIGRAVEDDYSGSFKIRSLALNRSYCRYYPMPLDIGISSTDKSHGRMLAPLEAVDNAEYSLTKNASSIKHLIGTEDNDLKKADAGDYFMSETMLEYYFHGIHKIYDLRNVNFFVALEPKVGIAREHDHTAKEGALYRANMNRFKEDTSISVELDGISNFEELTKIIKVGSEGKGAIVEGSDDGLWDNDKFNLSQIEDLITARKLFKVIFLTPAIFDSGWLPTFKGVKIKPVAASIGKPVLAGGWDMNKRWHKPMYKAVPAGSVFYYELGDVSVDDLANIHLKNHGKRSHEGFGFAFVAACN